MLQKLCVTNVMKFFLELIAHRDNQNPISKQATKYLFWTVDFL